MLYAAAAWNASRRLSVSQRDDVRVSLMSSEIETRIVRLIATTLHVDPARVRRDSRFARDLDADSLDSVSLILAIEDDLGIDIHDEDAAEILTVAQLIEYVTNTLEARASTIVALR
jgi:acyl carrier protein